MEGRGAEEGVEAAGKKEGWTASEARLLIEAQKASGLTVVEFARRHGFIPQRLHRWKGKLRQQERETTGPARALKSFVPVRLVTPRGVGGGTLEVVARGGHGIRVGVDFDAGHLRRVLAALEESC